MSVIDGHAYGTGLLGRYLITARRGERLGQKDIAELLRQSR